MAAMAMVNKHFVSNTWIGKEAGRRWTSFVPNAASKNAIDYVLIGARCILKGVCTLSSVNAESGHRVLRAYNSWCCEGLLYIKFLLLGRGY